MKFDIFKYHVFAPMGRFQLELFTFIFHRRPIYYIGLNYNKKPTKESNRSRNLSQTNQQHNSNPQQIKTSIPTKIKHVQ